jgi:2-hydroxychromene-2-carboxylate isomerase
VKTVEFYYSVGSRYSYLASTQLHALAAECNCRFEWLPVNSAELMSRFGRNPFAGQPVSGQYEWSYRERDAKRWAMLYGVPFLEPRGRVEFDSGQLALACTAARRLGHVVAYSRSLFSAMFIEPTTVIGREECVRRAADCGMTADTFANMLDDPATTGELEAVTARAHAAGVFGVPTFVMENQLFWGNDRLVLLREHLKKGNVT